MSPKAKVAPVECAVAPPISGQLTIEGIPVLGLVDTGASVTCLGFAIWWRYRAQWGALKQFEGTVHGAHGKPLNIAGRTEHLDIQWGEARGWASFIVIVGLESPPCLIGMDIMRPLKVHIDVTNGTATPAQSDPQTIHLNAAQRQQPQKQLPAPVTSPPPQPLTIRENPASGASLPTEGTAEPSSSQPQRWASFIVIVGLESPPCLIGMDIMRPLKVHIDVTNGTATPAQSDPQTIHLNAAQRQQPQKQLPAPVTSPPPQPLTIRENPASGASLPTEGTAEPSSSQPQRQKKRWLRPGAQLSLPRRFPPPPPSSHCWEPAKCSSLPCPTEPGQPSHC